MWVAELWQGWCLPKHDSRGRMRKIIGLSRSFLCVLFLLPKRYHSPVIGRKEETIKSYLLTALFNAGSTMSSYYKAMVNHDMPEFAGWTKKRNDCAGRIKQKNVLTKEKGGDTIGMRTFNNKKMFKGAMQYVNEL